MFVVTCTALYNRITQCTCACVNIMLRTLRFVEIPTSLNVDINECAPNNGKGPCSQMCSNTKGSFICSCDSGYSLIEYQCYGNCLNKLGVKVFLLKLASTHLHL